MKSTTLFSMILLLFLSACRGKIERDIYIQDPDSPLLPILMSEKDFSSDWNWVSSELVQRNPSISDSNGVVDFAKIVFSATYADQFILFFHRLEQFQTSIQIKLSDYQFGDLQAGEEIFTPEFIKLDTESYVQCVRVSSSAVVECKIFIVYDQLTSTLTFYGAAQTVAEMLSEAQIVEIINPIMAKIDERIRDATLNR